MPDANSVSMIPSNDAGHVVGDLVETDDDRTDVGGVIDRRGDECAQKIEMSIGADPVDEICEPSCGRVHCCNVSSGDEMTSLGATIDG